jgi:hypothetical protein
MGFSDSDACMPVEVDVVLPVMAAEEATFMVSFQNLVFLFRKTEYFLIFLRDLR